MKEKILKAFYFRHACKSFDPTKKVSKKDFEFILETARLSPSSFGLEPWHFLILQNKELRTELLDNFWGGKGQFPTASYLVFILARKSTTMRWNSSYIKHIMTIENLPKEVIKMRLASLKNFQKNDFRLLKNKNDLTNWSIHQCYIPLANMMTTASLLGIDTCPMEGFNRKKTEAILSKKTNFDKKKYTLAVALAFGYRKVEPRAKTRQDINDISTWIN